jgi:hypothetical protein
MFLADIRQHLIKGDEALEARLQLDKWVNDPGVPGNIAPADPAAFASADAGVAAFKTGKMPDAATWNGWTTDERLRFLTRIDKVQPPSGWPRSTRPSACPDRTARSASHFLDLAVKNRFDPPVPALEEFLTVQGRRKFVRPLITALAKDEQWGRPIAARSMGKQGLLTIR